MTDKEKLDQIKDITEEYKYGTKESSYYMEQVCDVINDRYNRLNWDHKTKK